ncbi:MAG: amino acid adenylation domain-containing protein [Colwellia sp.]|nr:amino acid adenylation domain-containing protein [Colwellia sp.]
MISQLIDVCRQSGIDFALGNGGKLKVNADKSALTPAILSQIKTAKAEIIAFLKAEKISELDRDFQTSVQNRADILARLNLTEQQIDGFYPLVPLQEGMLLQHMLSEQHDVYITYFILAVEGKQIFDKIMESFKAVVERHASCRTAIVWRGVEQAYQLVKKQVSIPIIHVHCANEGEFQQELQALKSQNRMMDLEQDALMRFHVLVKADSQEHVLFIERHHIVSDHISLELTLYELLMFYKQQQNQLHPAKQQYEFALQHNAEKAVDTGYFDVLLADFEAPSLLFDINQSQFKSTELEYFSYDFEANLQRAVREQSMKSGVSPAVLFHFAWAIVMAKFCNSKDVLFPTVLTGRMMAPEYRTTIGMFLNSLPLRVKFDERSVAEQLRDINIQLMQLCQNENVPLNQAVQKLTDEFGTVFNCIFNYRHATEEVLLDELPFEHILSKEESSTPFSLSISETGEAFSAELEAYKGTNGIALLDGLALALEYIVNELTEDSKAPFQMPLLLPDDMLQHLVYDLNDTAMDYPKDKCIHTLFEQQAQAQPDNVAVVFEDKQLTYRQLNEKANQLAHYLKGQHHITADTLIGLCVERSLEMVIGIMGILKAGGAYVPLDPGYPQDRLNYMLEDASLDVVLSQVKVQSVLMGFTGTIIALDGIDDKDSHFCSEYGQNNLTVEETGLTSGNLAYVIYTSGSTGLPKGVMIEHASLINYQEHVRIAYGLTQADNFLQFSNISFDIFIEEFFGALCQGSQLTLRDEACQFGIKVFIDFCNQYEITVVSLPTAFWAQLVSSKDKLASTLLRVVIVGGEALSTSTVQNHYQLFSTNVALINSYGPTEATVTATTYMTSSADDLSKVVPIGKVNINNQLFVMDQFNAICPLNCVGELYIGGKGLARGYLNRPELTSETFIDNPFYDVAQLNSSTHLYRTGDLVRYLPDGNLEFIGRADDQVKIQGFRVELGEVELQLVQQVIVDSAIVITKEVSGSHLLVGYVKSEGGFVVESQAEFIQQVQMGLKKKLPDYMIPNILMVVEEWPLTPNGKVDRKALPKPDGSQMQGEYVAPKTETEKTIVGQIESIIGIDVDKLSVSESFLNLGGNSILSLRLSQSLGSVFEIELPILLILESHSIKELALELDLILSIKNAEKIENTENTVEEEW